MVELAVIRGIGKDSPISDKLYSWLSDVVTKACNVQRNIQVIFFHPSGIIFSTIHLISQHILVVWPRLVSILGHTMPVFLGGQRAIQKLWIRRSMLTMIRMLLVLHLYHGVFSGCHAPGDNCPCLWGITQSWPSSNCNSWCWPRYFFQNKTKQKIFWHPQ